MFSSTPSPPKHLPKYTSVDKSLSCMQITGLSDAYVQGGIGTCNEQLQRAEAPLAPQFRLRGSCPTQSCSRFCPQGLQQQADNLIYLFQRDLPLSPLTFFFFFHLSPSPAIPGLQLWLSVGEGKMFLLFAHFPLADLQSLRSSLPAKTRSLRSFRTAAWRHIWHIWKAGMD